jgi:hypothetical protein
MKPLFLPDEGFRVDGGLATFGPETLKLRATLDTLFVAWAEESRAVGNGIPTLDRRRRPRRL